MASTIVGGIVETKEIGLSIGISKGTHNDTFFDTTDNSIKLKILGKDANNNPVYKEEGFWISDVIVIDDKFLNYQKIFTTHTNNGSLIDKSLSSIKIQTRVSKDGINWDGWVDTNTDGTINSATTWQETLGDGTIVTHVKRYAQVKIIFKAGFITDVFLISEFDDEADKDIFVDNTFIDTTNGLRLKRNYEWELTKDATWSDTGTLHRKVISRNEWLRLDKLNVVEKVV